MEHESEDPSGQPDNETREPPVESSGQGCGLIVAKIIGLGIVAFIVVVGLVFGVCLFG